MAPVRILWTESPYQLLPAEILLTTLALTNANANLPATCRSFSEGAFTAGEQPHRAWLHRHIFSNPGFEPELCVALGAPFRVDWVLNRRRHYHNAFQMESNVAYFLKSLVPSEHGIPAVGMAPESSELASPCLLKSEVEWLFSPSGPFGSQARRHQFNQSALEAELHAVRERGQPVRDSDGKYVEPAPSPSPKSPIRGWNLVPDALLLVSFFIRTSNFQLLELALEKFLAALPSLSSAHVPFSVWTHFALDNRLRLRMDLNFVIETCGNPTMSYPTFLCVLAIMDWSLPAVKIVERAFPAGTVDLATVAHQIVSTTSIFRGMLATLEQVTEPSFSGNRAVAVLQWLGSHNCNTKRKCAMIQLRHFRFLSLFTPTSNHALFCELFLNYDHANLCQVPREHPEREWLGDRAAQSAMAGYGTGALQVALENDLVCKETQKRLLIKAAKNMHKKWAGEVIKCLRDNGHGRYAKISKILRPLCLRSG